MLFFTNLLIVPLFSSGISTCNYIFFDLHLDDIDEFTSSRNRYVYRVFSACLGWGPERWARCRSKYIRRGLITFLWHALILGCICWLVLQRSFVSTSRVNLPTLPRRHLSRQRWIALLRSSKEMLKQSKTFSKWQYFSLGKILELCSDLHNYLISANLSLPPSALTLLLVRNLTSYSSTQIRTAT